MDRPTGVIGTLISVFETKTQVLHRYCGREGFFRGENGSQILAKVYYVFGKRLYYTVLDEEIVPHWHYVQQATLGSSEWRSRLCNENGEPKYFHGEDGCSN